MAATGTEGARRTVRRVVHAREPEEPDAARGPERRARGPPAPTVWSRTVATQADLDVLQFLAAATHDLSGPLTPIKLQLHLLGTTDGPSAAGRRGLEIIGRNVEHLDHLIADLKEASRVAAGKVRIDVAPLDLAALAKETVESFVDAAFRDGIALSYEGAPAVPVEGDRSRLRQVLYNLVGNALKFTPKGGAVTVTVEAGDRAATCRVRDTGLGLSEEDRAGLFRPFSQAHGPEQRRKGTGLGLYISRGIVEAHGGEIGCESAGPGLGSTFRFRLPQRKG
ncbi:MAG: sensor histidine kinase [Methanobacteriota archaeon]